MPSLNADNQAVAVLMTRADSLIQDEEHRLPAGAISSVRLPLNKKPQILRTAETAMLPNSNTLLVLYLPFVRPAPQTAFSAGVGLIR